MSDESREEQRALSKDEFELASPTRGPGLQEMSAGELADLVTRLRDRRDRARDMAERQRREMRGKAAPAGASGAGDNSGTRSKEHFLAAALDRAQAERQCREQAEGGPTQTELAEKALEMRKDAEAGGPHHPPNEPTPDEGMQPVPNEGIAPSGALDAEGYKPVLERSRKVR
ncbi:hypothetical protein BH23PSE1_BH23PSE1_15420 [soil metagenome]